jgi:hypothetical protein
VLGPYPDSLNLISSTMGWGGHSTASYGHLCTRINAYCIGMLFLRADTTGRGAEGDARVKWWNLQDRGPPYLYGSRLLVSLALLTAAGWRGQ